MAVPDFQSVMRPLLEAIEDRKEHSVSELVERLAVKLGLTEEDRRERIPSGQTRFDNRVQWARTYLAKAALVESTRRGYFRITSRGEGVLAKGPPRITTTYLSQFPEFQEFKELSRHSEGESKVTSDTETGETPSERLESAYQTLNAALATDLLEKVKAGRPEAFEQLVVELLVEMGYGGSEVDAGRAVGGSGDGGIDGVINQDPLGLDVVYVQAKRWEQNVGRPTVQAFAGALEGKRASKGVLITTSDFTPDARAFADQIHKRIILISGQELAKLMIAQGIGVSNVATYVVRRLDSDYFDEI